MSSNTDDTQRRAFPYNPHRISMKDNRIVTVHHSLQGFFSIRKGKWKLTPYLGSGGFTQPDLIIPQNGETPGTLFDMEKDPREQVNLYNQFPDVVRELSSLMQLYVTQGYSIPQNK